MPMANHVKKKKKIACHFALLKSLRMDKYGAILIPTLYIIAF